jgi:hypothetical protein
MPKWTAEQEARYALANGVSRQDLSKAAQVVYDQLKAEREAARTVAPDESPLPPPRTPQRSSPETRANILEMFKRGNAKYAKPFEKDRLAMLSVFGGNWEEYGQIVLQMAILDTLLSIEEKLSALDGLQATPDSHNTTGA